MTEQVDTTQTETQTEQLPIPDSVKAKADKLRERLEARRRQILKLEAEAEALLEEYEALMTITQLKPGSVVAFMVGRGETRRELLGTITGIGETPAGVRYKVYTGLGFNAEITTLKATDIKRVHSL